MTTICVVPIEGVLSQAPNLKEAQPTKWARMLYDGLHTQYQMIALTANEPEIARYWLQREMLRDWAGVLTMPDAYANFGDWKVKQIEEFLAEGWEVGLVIDTVDHVLERISLLGVVTMLLSYPSNRVGWRDTTPEVRAWTDVVSDLR
jgi:hypothetical protein